MENEEKIENIKKMLIELEEKLNEARSMLRSLTGEPPKRHNASHSSLGNENGHESSGGTIIEGTFDGEKMIDPHGKFYQVPVNYSSKSKLVEGDKLKLTILSDGSFIYKQIGPVPRKKVVGLLQNDDGDFKVGVSGRTYNVLYASVTYFRAKEGDRITLVIPNSKEAQWGAIENVLPANVATA